MQDILVSKDPDFTLTKLDNRPVSDDKNEVRAFIVAGNEASRLPFLLEHHRKLGVSRFFIVDDKSTDGSREYLLSQTDCHVFDPSNTYKQARSGLHWRAVLLDNYGINHWSLSLDADELFIYPHCEIISLRDFCDYLDTKNATSFFAFMLDLYAPDNLKAVCEPQKPFYEICPYFDRDYKFRETGAAKGDILPRIRVAGGPRVRLFYPMQKHVGYFMRATTGLFIKAAEKMPFWKRNKPHYAPALIKMPLLKWQKGMKRLTSHVIEKPLNGHMADVTGVLLHFKFFADFQQKANNTIAKGHYFNGSQEYQRYMAYTRKHPDFTFMYEGSTAYKNSDSVLNSGLMRTTADYDAFAQNQLNPLKNKA